MIGKIHYSSDCGIYYSSIKVIRKIHFSSLFGRITVHSIGKIHFSSLLGRFTVHSIGKMLHNPLIASPVARSTACFQRVLLTRWLEPAGDGLIACDDKHCPKNSHSLGFPCQPNCFRWAPSFPIRRPCRRICHNCVCNMNLWNMWKIARRQGNCTQTHLR